MEVKTKYNIGDEVWTMLNNRPHCFRIAAIEVFRNSLRTFVRNVEHTNTGTRNNPHTCISWIVLVSQRKKN